MRGDPQQTPRVRPSHYRTAGPPPVQFSLHLATWGKLPDGEPKRQLLHIVWNGKW